MKQLALSDEILMKIEKPARYVGQEVNMIEKDPKNMEIRFCMCFPDVYEVGMSHLGMQLLYDMFNRRDDTYCERVYSPWPDLDVILRQEKIPLFALESQEPIKNFDFLGITLQYEMCYTNVLQILDLSQIPIFSSERTNEDPFVIGGGPCAFNPEPIADFFDFFYIGEGETVYDQVLDCYKICKSKNVSRKEYLEAFATIEGIYVPSLYEVSYWEDGTLKAFLSLHKNAKQTIKKQVVSDFSESIYPEKPLVPHIRIVQDRVVLEIQRGCIRGCRFCQAGMLYRPIRERNLEFLKKQAAHMLNSTGYEEISLSSLSSSDYGCLPELISYLMEEFSKKGVNISLPSLRIDAFALDVMSKIQDIKKSSLTFAPEAGSQRLRDVINKGLTEEEILRGAMDAFLLGWNKVKLYFMLGLPSETDEDIQEIAVLSDKIAREYYTIPKEERNGKASIVVSTSFFIPKPFTPFQWVGMISKEAYLNKKQCLHKTLKEQLNYKSIRYNWHDGEISLLEGLFARGDRKLSKAIYAAYQAGCMFDAWSEYFNFSKWEQVLKEQQIDLNFYITRERGEEERFPWDFIDVGVSKQFLFQEYKKAQKEEVTKNCKQACSACGAAKYHCGVCIQKANQKDIGEVCDCEN